MLLEPRSPASVFLHAQPWFSCMSASEKNELLDAMVLRKASKGDVLLAAGEPIDAWYGVLSGMAKLQTKSHDGKLSAFLGVPAGEWFGEGSVLKEDVWRYDVVALRDTTLIGMPMIHFKRLYRSSLPFAHFLIDHLNMRLGQAMAAIESGRLRNPEERVAQYLSHFSWAGISKITLSQEDLGHLAGLSRQTINRVLKQFESQGWVSLEFGRVDIVNHEALQQLANPIGTKATPDSGQSFP